MTPQQRIFVALDRAELDKAVELAQMLAPWIGGVKVGLELLTYAGAPQVMQALAPLRLPIFFDGKFQDIPNTVAGAVRGAVRLGAALLNVHALGGPAMMRAAVTARREAAVGSTSPKMLAVTILTSLTATDVAAVGFPQVTTTIALQQLVVHLARLAQDAGCDGVVASPQEIAAIRAACGPNFLIVTPGVRPHWAAAGDQQRTLTPAEAVQAGADYLVIGRPITAPPPEIGGPVAAAQQIAAELAPFSH